jgi:WD40 repeat protein
MHTATSKTWLAIMAIALAGVAVPESCGQELLQTIRVDSLPLAFSPDDRYLAVDAILRGRGGLSHVTVWETATGKEVTQLAIDRPDWAAFQPNSTKLVIAADPYGELSIWDFVADATTPVIADPPDAKRVWTHATSISDDGQLVSVSFLHVNQTTVMVRNLTDGKIVLEDKLGDWRVNHTGFSPDGKRLIALGERREDRRKRFSLHVFCWDLESRERTNQWGPFPKSGTLVKRSPFQYGIDAMSRDGRWIATTTPGNGILLTEVATGRTRQLGPHPITGTAKPFLFGELGGMGTQPGRRDCDIWQITFSPDGQYMATSAMGSDIVSLWPVAGSNAPTHLKQPEMIYMSRLRFSPSSKLLAVFGSMLPDNAPRITHIWRLTGKGP